jgi:hypothetical protein
VVHDIRELLGLSLARLNLLVSLLQLGIEVLEVALGTSQLVLGVLQQGVGTIECVSLEVEAAVRTQQVIVQLLVAPLKCVSLLE